MSDNTDLSSLLQRSDLPDPEKSPFLPEPEDTSLVETPILKNSSGVSLRGLLSLATMFVSLISLTVAMAAGTKVVFDVFNTGFMNVMSGIGIKAIVLAMAYLFGWAMALFSIRTFDNLILPIIIRTYAWMTLAGVCFLYLMIIRKLYLQNYDTDRYWGYLIMTIAGLVVVVGLHLILDGHDLRPFAIPLLIIAAVQLSSMVMRYVFTSDANPSYLLGDFFFFFMITLTSGMMLAHLGVLSPIRFLINLFYERVRGFVRFND